MNLLSKKECLFFSQMLYKINHQTTFARVAEDTLLQLQVLIPYTKSMISSIKLGDRSMDRAETLCLSENGTIISMKELNTDDTKNSTVYEYLYFPNSSVFRQTDIINAEERENTEHFQKFWKTQNIYYGLHIALVYEGNPIGTLALFRPKTSNDFDQHDLLIANMLKDHLAFKLYQLQVSPHTLNTSADTVSNSIEKIYEKTRSNRLTPRECEIFYYLMKGLDTSEICEQLCIEQATLRKHTYNLYQKLNINSRTQLLVWASKHLKL